MTKIATLHFEDKHLEMPVVVGTEDEHGIDIAKLRGQTGLVTLDPGYGNTGSCLSGITFIDGEKGILRYRGYPIEQIAQQGNFLETAYLLINGELPSKQQFENFENGLMRHTLIHEDMKRFFEAFPLNAHPMAILASAITALSTYYELENDGDADQDIVIQRLIAKAPTIAAFAYKKSRGQPFVYPDNRLDYVSNFMRMMFGFPTEPFEPDPVVVKALDMLLILHADHEQNCSTSTVRLVGSSGANLHAAVAAGVTALWGPLHGGANQKVLEMLAEIVSDGGDVKKAVARAKDKDSGFRLMGFGHRVYKNFDPRAKLIKSACDDVLARLGTSDPMLAVAQELEGAALEDDYFVERKLYPNVDFYSGIIFRAIGIPTNMFTVLFALGRLPGWIAQFMEMKGDPGKIGRPRQIYTGHNERQYVPIDNRG